MKENKFLNPDKNEKILNEIKKNIDLTMITEQKVVIKNRWGEQINLDNDCKIF